MTSDGNLSIFSAHVFFKLEAIWLRLRLRLRFIQLLHTLLKQTFLVLLLEVTSEHVYTLIRE